MNHVHKQFKTPKIQYGLFPFGNFLLQYACTLHNVLPKSSKPFDFI